MSGSVNVGIAPVGYVTCMYAVIDLTLLFCSNVTLTDDMYVGELTGHKTLIVHVL